MTDVCLVTFYFFHFPVNPVIVFCLVILAHVKKLWHSFNQLLSLTTLRFTPSVDNIHCRSGKSATFGDWYLWENKKRCSLPLSNLDVRNYSTLIKKISHEEHPKWKKMARKTHKEHISIFTDYHGWPAPLWITWRRRSLCFDVSIQAVRRYNCDTFPGPYQRI